MKLIKPLCHKIGIKIRNGVDKLNARAYFWGQLTDLEQKPEMKVLKQMLLGDLP